MRRNRWWLIGIAVVAIAAVMYGVLRPDGSPKPQADAPQGRGRAAAPVVVATAATQPFAINLQIIGSVQAFATVAVKSRVDGQLNAAHFKEGQFVKQGDKLFTIDPRPFEASLKQAEAALARDRAQLVRAREDLNRYADLVKKEFSSRQKFEEAKANAAAAEATVHADEAMLENARLNLEYTQILSPIDGRTGSLMIAAGNLVKANDSNPIVVINQTHPIYVQFSVAEKYLPEVRRRMAEGPLAVSATIPPSASSTIRSTCRPAPSSSRRPTPTTTTGWCPASSSTSPSRFPPSPRRWSCRRRRCRLTSTATTCSW